MRPLLVKIGICIIVFFVAVMVVFVYRLEKTNVVPLGQKEWALFESIKRRHDFDRFLVIPSASQWRDNFRWNAPFNESMTTGIPWHRIVTPRLQGFSPTPALLRERAAFFCEVEAMLGSADAKWNAEQFFHSLRVENNDGVCYTRIWLEIEDGHGVETLDTRDKFIKRFAPVDTEAEAAAFIGTTMRQSNVQDIVEGYTAVFDDGFLVLTVANDFGSHGLGFVLYKVSTAGDIQVLANQK